MQEFNLFFRNIRGQENSNGNFILKEKELKVFYDQVLRNASLAHMLNMQLDSPSTDKFLIVCHADQLNHKLSPTELIFNMNKKKPLKK
jgi:hypothetical protein